MPVHPDFLARSLCEIMDRDATLILDSFTMSGWLTQWFVARFPGQVIDAGPLGKEGVDTFKRLVREAEAAQRDLAAVLILNDDQRNWVDDALSVGNGEVIVRPVTMTTLYEVLADHLPELAPPDENDDSEES